MDSRSNSEISLLFENLPEEILVHIATYLTLIEAANLARVSKYSKEIAKDAILNHPPTREILPYLQLPRPLALNDKLSAYHIALLNLTNPIPIDNQLLIIEKYLTGKEYQDLKNKIEKKQELTSKEMLVYALVTDDILTVNYDDLDKAYAATKDKLTSSMQENIECMLATIKAFNSEKKPEIHEFLRTLNNIRKNYNKSYFNLSNLKLNSPPQTEEIRYMHLAGANLQNAHLNNLNTEKANFANANLFNSDLSNSRFIRADFVHANLYRAILKTANFQGAFFCGKIFKDENLHEEDIFSSAHVIRQNFSQGKEIQELKDDLNFLHDQIKNHQQFNQFEKVAAQNIAAIVQRKIQNPTIKKAFLETALGHSIFKQPLLKQAAGKISSLFGQSQPKDPSNGRELLERELANLSPSTTPSPKK